MRASFVRMGRLERSGRYLLGRAAWETPPRTLKRSGELGFQEFPQLRRSFELWNGIQFFECRSEGIRETPERSRPEVLVLRLMRLCCRQHNTFYVAQRFMWRPP